MNRKCLVKVIENGEINFVRGSLIGFGETYTIWDIEKNIGGVMTQAIIEVEEDGSLMFSEIRFVTLGL